MLTSTLPPGGIVMGAFLSPADSTIMRCELLSSGTRIMPGCILSTIGSPVGLVSFICRMCPANLP